MKTFYEFFELFGKKKTVFIDYASNKYEAYYDDNDEKKKIYPESEAASCPSRTRVSFGKAAIGASA